ncbi:DUF488 domain-containing protein [Candidatus Bathyarchaeota archaeon]|nr:DUF488 domain-containing protein [Candidatus Bathyarchaeota archaeon]
MTRISTIGYGGKKPNDFFIELDLLSPDKVIDVRENPFRAYLGCYTKSYLEKKLGEKYIWIKELGNKSRALPPTLVDEEKGLQILMELCQDCSSIVLLCAEKDEKRCHRGYVKLRIESMLEKQV